MPHYSYSSPLSILYPTDMGLDFQFYHLVVAGGYLPQITILSAKETLDFFQVSVSYMFQGEPGFNIHVNSTSSPQRKNID